MDKSSIRKEAKTNRKLILNEKKKYDLLIYNSVVNLNQYKNASSIFIYLDFNYEVDTRMIISNAIKNGKKVYLPKIHNNKMITIPIDNLENLKPNKFNILEPTGESKAIDDNTLKIMPGVAFSEFGERVGYGGGFYDKFLEGKSNELIALSYECQVYKKLPVEQYDIKVPIIITEKRIINNK